jgi:hypothetical protein
VRGPKTPSAEAANLLESIACFATHPNDRGERMVHTVPRDAAMRPAAGVGRVFCRQCLDWSKRRPHLAGTLGVALACRRVELEWVRKIEGPGALGQVKGRQGFQRYSASV